MVSKRKLEIAIAVAILIMVVILLIILLRPKSTPGPTAPRDDSGTEEQVLPEVNPASIPAPGVVSATTVARTFVERFGSYSSESNFANVDDIRVLATPSYQAELDQQVAALRRGFDEDAGYTGISTSIISIKTDSASDTAVTFLITTQRSESVGSPGNTTIRYQDVEIDLVKSGEDWLVNDLTWL